MSCRFHALAGWVLLALATAANAQDVSKVDERYVVRTVDSKVMLIDLQTGWTWKRADSSSGKPPRWSRTEKFSSGEEAREWLEGNPTETPDPREAVIIPWATEILLGPEYQGPNASKRMVRRWVSSPTISVFGANAEQSKLVQSAVDKLNAVLKSARTAVRFKPVQPNDERASIKVHFMRFAEFTDFCKQHDMRHSGVDDAFFWNNWDSTGRFTDAQVLIANDRSTSAKLKHLVLEEITQTLGAMNDSPRKKDSIFFGGYSEVPDLSSDDRQLLTLLYSRMKAGEPRSRIERAIRRYWVFGPTEKPKP